MFKPLLITIMVATIFNSLCGCSDPEALPELISTPGAGDNISPSASFTSICNDLDCDLDASTSADSDGNIISYKWDFGDGFNGSAISATHSYKANGNYTVLLTVTDDFSATSSSSQMLSVSSGNIPPVASFTSSCPDLSCSFDASASSDGDGDIAEYSWNFGDGATGTGEMVNYSFSVAGDYLITMTVTDNAGANSSSSLTVSVSIVGGGNNPPSASFTSDCPDLSCNFDASASSDSDGTIAGYAWDFGDGAISNLVTPNHTYTTDGNYTVLLTVTDNSGAGSTSTQTLFVTNGNSSPSAVFSKNCTDLDCNFDASSSFDTDGSLVSYDWDFGDGMNGDGITVSHLYSTDGGYSVVLTVTDNEGANSSSAQSITVSKPTTLDGQSLFDDNCASCHGADAQGGALAPVIVGRTASDIQNAINTVNQMKSLSSLTNEEVQAISDYLGTL